MKVMTQLTQCFAWLDQQALVATLEEVTAFSAKPVEAIGKGGLEPLHACDQIPVRSFDREMIVVAHDDECMEEPVGFQAGLEQAVFKRSARFLVAKNLGAVVAAIQDVITCAGKFEPQLSRHVGKLASVETRATLNVKT